MYYLSIGAIFKNEAMGFKEWLDHHIVRGVEHFYLINDNSSDNYISIIEPYIDAGIITLYHANEHKYNGRQSAIYDKFLLPHLRNRDTRWMAVIDLDEYLYSPKTANLQAILQCAENCAQVELNWVMFGSNGHITQPKSIVEGFTKTDGYTAPSTKTIINSFFEVATMNIHAAETYGQIVNMSWFASKDDPVLLINHYHLQSLEYWQKVKLTRGDADCYIGDSDRSLEFYKKRDINTHDDFRLIQQNKTFNNHVTVYSTEYPKYNYVSFPQNTYHKYCKNFMNGSIYGEDGILDALLQELNFPGTMFYDITGNNKCNVLSCFRHNMNGYLIKKYNFILNQTKIYNEAPTDLSNVSVLSIDYDKWYTYNVSPYHSKDPKIVIIDIQLRTFKQYMDLVQNTILKKYVPVAVTKSSVIIVAGGLTKNIKQFPVVSTDKYPILFTNLFYQSQWYVDPKLDIEVAKRNYYIRHNRFINEEKKAIWLQDKLQKYGHEIWNNI